MASRPRHRNIPVQRRSKSCHQPYKSVTETYIKEVINRPVRTSPSRDDVYYILDDFSESEYRRREYPVINIDNSEPKKSEIETPRYSIPRQPFRKPSSSIVCNVTPPTPKKTSADPMYREYILQKSESDENHNSTIIPIARPRSKSPSVTLPVPEKAPRGQYRNNAEEEKNKPKRIVYSHDVYVDSMTGRPFTPGRNDLDNKNCSKLKINVYFQPPHPPVQSTYTLDEIQIEKSEEIQQQEQQHQSPPRAPTVIINSDDDISVQKEVAPIMSSHFNRRPQSRSSILRKQSEILTIPLRTESVRQSRTSHRSYNSELRNDQTNLSTTSEKTIPVRMEESSINMDDIFPKVQNYKTDVELRNPSLSQREPSVELQRSTSTIRDVYQNKTTASERTFSRRENSTPASSSKSSHRELPKNGSQRSPVEEVVHIREKYERDETIRRFYPSPTTTTV